MPLATIGPTVASTPAPIASVVASAGSIGALVGAAIAMLNAADASLRMRSAPGNGLCTERVCVIVPARNEAALLPDVLADLATQRGLRDLRVVVVDDHSTDGTSDVARRAVNGDPRFEVLHADTDDSAAGNSSPGTSPAGTDSTGSGTTGTGTTGGGKTGGGTTGGGKTAACAAGARRPAAETSTVVVFLDADVRLGPDAVRTAVDELRRTGADLVCPWPRQGFGDPLGALLAPLLAWSWSSTLPLRLSEALGRPSMAVACGQFLVFDTRRYQQFGGHDRVRTAVTEDLALAREVRRAGGRSVVRYAPDLAACTMYRSVAQTRSGHRRWLLPTIGGPAAVPPVVGYLAVTHLLPPIMMIRGRNRAQRVVGASGYLAAVAGRLLVRAAETGGRPTAVDIVSALLHPVGAATIIGLLVDSARAHRLGAVVWKDRVLRTR